MLLVFVILIREPEIKRGTGQGGYPLSQWDNYTLRRGENILIIVSVPGAPADMTERHTM